MSRGFDQDPVVVDHMLLITSPQHRRRYQRAWQRMVRQPGGVFEPHIMHEDDDSCCALEPWPISLSKLIAATGAKTLVVRW